MQSEGKDSPADEGNLYFSLLFGTGRNTETESISLLRRDGRGSSGQGCLEKSVSGLFPETLNG